MAGAGGDFSIEALKAPERPVASGDAKDGSWYSNFSELSGQNSSLLCLARMAQEAWQVVTEHPLQVTAGVIGIGISAKVLHNSALATNELGSFLKYSHGLFDHDEIKLLRSIDWKQEARLPSLIDHYQPGRQQMVIGKLAELQKYPLEAHQFVLKWPEHGYSALDKAQNLSYLNRWLNRGGSILDITAPGETTGFLRAERVFISRLARPGQYQYLQGAEKVLP